MSIIKEKFGVCINMQRSRQKYAYLLSPIDIDFSKIEDKVINKN